MEQIINNALGFIKLQFDRLIDAVKNQPQKLSIDLGASSAQLESAATALGVLIGQMEKNAQKQAMGQELNELRNIFNGLSSLNASVKAIPPTDLKDIKETNRLLKELSNKLDGGFNPEVVVDMSELKAIVSVLVDLKDTLMQNAPQPDPRLDNIMESLSSIASKKMIVPDTIKLEENQLRQIRGGGGSGGGPIPATHVVVKNLALTSANTEYSYALPKNTVGFFIKLRGQAVIFYMSWDTGTLPSSGDGSSYITIPQSGYRMEGNFVFDNKTLYFESASSSQVVEIEAYCA